MLIVIRTNSPYSEVEDMWKKINSIPTGVVFHEIRQVGVDGIDHFFSNQQITKQQIDAEYEIGEDS